MKKTIELFVIVAIVGLSLNCKNPMQQFDITEVEEGSTEDGGTSEVLPDDGDGVVELTISMSVSSSRTLTPSTDMSIDYYEISGDGPGTETFTVNNITGTSHTEPGLAIGEWAITVDAYNSSAEKIGSGSAAVTVESGHDAAVTVTVVPLTGSGTLSVEINWPTGELSSPGIDATLTPSGGSASPITFTVAGETATYEDTNLTAGYYILQANVKEGTVIRYSIFEVVRILSAQITNGVYALTADMVSMDSCYGPTFSPSAGTYGSGQAVTITSATAGTTIRYTINGSIPTETTGIELVNGGSVQINSTSEVKAIAYKSGYNNSQVKSAIFDITGSIATPSVDMQEGLYYDPINVTLTCDTPNTTIIYTTDGSDPVPGSNGTEYTGPISLGNHTETTIKMIAYENGNMGFTSDIVEAWYKVTETVAQPVVSVSTGTYNTDQTVTLTCSTADAELYYTIDGTIPSETNGTLYTVPLDIGETTILKVIGVKTEWGDSAVETRTYTMTVGTPSFSVSSGTYNTEQSFTITTATAGSTIYYTTDGSTPSDVNGTLYSGTITIDQSMIVRAIAYRSGWTDSEIRSNTYTLQVVAPLFSLAGGDYPDTSLLVGLTTTTAGATISYTIDGTEPTPTHGTVGTNATVTATNLVGGATNLKVVAFKPGWSTSTVSSSEFSLGVHIIPNTVRYESAVHALDIDGDGDTDVLCQSAQTGEIAWLENDGSENYTEHHITYGVDSSGGQSSVYPIDFDGDGDIDVLGASYSAGEIAWWANDGSENFSKHIVDGSIVKIASIYAADLDGDGDMDVLGAATDPTNEIAWWENEGSNNFTKHILDGTFSWPECVHAEDIDNDGDIDVLGGSAATSGDGLTWWENDGSGNFTGHLIGMNSWAVYPEDIDRDGDVDILIYSGIVSSDDYQISWYENDGSENFTRNAIVSSGSFYKAVSAVDVDSDGDMDVVAAASASRDFFWYENNGYESFVEHKIDGDLEGARSVTAADIDGDGDMDVLGAYTSDDGVIIWWENTLVP